MKVLVAVPVYDGKLQVQTVAALLQEQALAVALGDELQFRFLPSCSQIGMGRNQFAHDFLESDCERLFYLDADVSFEPGSILKLVHYPEDFVGGAYRFKLENECYPIGWLPDPERKGLYTNENGLLQVATMTGGFLSLSRKVFERLKAAHPHREYSHFDRKHHCFFQMPYQGGHLWSEDSLFSVEWRQAGGQIYLDPSITLTHWDFNRPFSGNIGRWLKGQSALPLSA